MELYFGRPIVWSHNGEVPEYLTSHGRTSGELTRYFREKLIKNLRGARRLTAPHVWKGCLIQYRDTFSSYHPIINFLYFGLVIAFTMFLMHPVSLAISLASALVYAVYLNGRRAVRFSLLYMLPMMVVAALVNPAFNHEGATILTYLPSGNPLTLESILYGAAAAAMLAAVVTWFSCYTAVMTSDKFVYLFGRVIPALSLVLSMTLRFVPKFQAQLQVVSEAQRCIGRDVSNGGVLRRLRNAITILSIMVTWSLESAIETADSMKSRGYGLPGRTAFSIYRFDSRDQSALSWLLYCGFFLCCGAAAGLNPHYVVFHVSDVSIEEGYTYHWLHTNQEVIDAAVEVINLILGTETWPFEFLVENQWWPGFTFTEPEETVRLLEGIRFAGKGILLDTGHLMNACTGLKSEAEGADYIRRMLNRHGSLATWVRGVHLHQSLSGEYVKAHTGLLPAGLPEDYGERFGVSYQHILQIDQHRPWTDPAILPVLEQIGPRYLTHELSSRGRMSRAEAMAAQARLFQQGGKMGV